MSIDNENQNTEKKQNISFHSICEIMESSKQSISIDRINLDITGDLASAAVLTQLRYWFGPSGKTGQSRTTIRKEGKLWIARKDSDWWDECGVTPKQIKRIKIDLIALNLVETKVFRFNNLTYLHWHLNLEVYTKLFNEIYSKNVCALYQRDNLECTKGIIRNVPKGQSINNYIKQPPYSITLKKNKANGATAVQLSLIYENVEELRICFSAGGTAIKWLKAFGYKESIAIDLFKDHQKHLFPTLMYMRNRIEDETLGPLKSFTGYFKMALEKKYYLNPPDKKK